MASSSNTLSFLTSIFASFAFFFSWSSNFSCNFVSFSSVQDTGLSLGFGLWSHSWYAISTSLNGSIIFQACITYGSTPIDGMMRLARIFSSLAVIIGGTFFLKDVIGGCLNPNKRRNTRLEGLAYLMACVFQGLSLLLLDSTTVCTDNQLISQIQSEIDKNENVQIDFDDKCSISTGARFCIVAIVFWFLAALASCRATSALKKEEETKVESNMREPLVPGDIL